MNSQKLPLPPISPFDDVAVYPYFVFWGDAAAQMSGDPECSFLELNGPQYIREKARDR